jgi:hypothetical protein
MASNTPKGWEKDSDKLYIHETGVRIQRMLYRGKDGWYLVPLDLDQTCQEFEPTNEGRDQAFEAFAKGVLTAAKPKKPRAPKKAKPVAPPPEDGEETEAKEEGEGDEEKEAAEEPDEGDDD